MDTSEIKPKPLSAFSSGTVFVLFKDNISYTLLFYVSKCEEENSHSKYQVRISPGIHSTCDLDVHEVLALQK